MNQLILLQLILVIFVVQCNSRSSNRRVAHYDCSSQEHDSSECGFVNEVRHNCKHHNAESSKAHSDNNSHIRDTNFVKDFAGKEEEYTVETDQFFVEIDAVRRTGTIKNETCDYQHNRNMEEDEEETESTLIDYPFSVSIQKKGAHYVTGALIDKRWILSVAGEFYHVRDTLKLFRARLGSVDCKRGGSLVPIKRIEIHPYYIYGKPNFDVGLLRMALPVDYSEVLRPIGISNIKGKVLSAKFMTTYWPRIVVKGKTIPQTAKERLKHSSMRVSTQRLIPIDKCKSIMTAMREFINESSLCLRPVIKHHSVCMKENFWDCILVHTATYEATQIQSELAPYFMGIPYNARPIHTGNV